MSGNAWRNFTSGIWQENIDVRDFIVKNYTPYDGNESFLASSSAKTEKLWNKCKELLKEEHLKDGVLSIDTNTISGITSHSPGYIDEENELIKGLQTDSPLKRAVIPFGGIRMTNSPAKNTTINSLRN